MKLYEEKNIKFKPITAITIILGIAFVVSLFFNVTGLADTIELRQQSNNIQKEKDSLLKRVKMSRPILKKDSLKVIRLENSIKEKDSLLNLVNKSEEYYRNKWFKTYKQLQDAQNTYNNASRRERDSLAAELAKREG